jgi:hypothetical protein
VRLRPGDAGWQQALERAHAGALNPLCLCRPDGVPMYVARCEQFMVKRLPDSGHHHHPTCPSYEPPASQSGLGEVLGEAVIERAPDRLEVRPPAFDGEKLAEAAQAVGEARRGVERAEVAHTAAVTARAQIQGSLQ